RNDVDQVAALLHELFRGLLECLVGLLCPLTRRELLEAYEPVGLEEVHVLWREPVFESEDRHQDDAVGAERLGGRAGGGGRGRLAMLEHGAASGIEREYGFEYWIGGTGSRGPGGIRQGTRKEAGSGWPAGTPS